jgi:hypothetical protein
MPVIAPIAAEKRDLAHPSRNSGANLATPFGPDHDKPSNTKRLCWTAVKVKSVGWWMNAIGRSGRRCIARGEVFVDLVKECHELALFELNGADAASAFGCADQRRVHQLEDGVLAESV